MHNGAVTLEKNSVFLPTEQKLCCPCSHSEKSKDIAFQLLSSPHWEERSPPNMLLHDLLAISQGGVLAEGGLPTPSGHRECRLVEGVDGEEPRGCQCDSGVPFFCFCL